MKKITRILIFLIILIILALSINLVKNFLIIHKNIGLLENEFENLDNYHIEILKNTEDNQVFKTEIYYQKAKYLINTYENDIVTATYYKNYKNGKDASVFADGTATVFLEEIVDEYSLSNLKIISDDFDICKMIAFSGTCIINTDENYNIIKRNGYKNYYNKQTGLLEKRINCVNNETEEINIELNLLEQEINLK